MHGKKYSLYEEKRPHYNTTSLRRQYADFLNEDQRRKERNRNLLTKLESIQQRAVLLQNKTDRIKSLKMCYDSYARRPVIISSPLFDNIEYKSKMPPRVEVVTSPPPTVYVQPQQFMPIPVYAMPSPNFLLNRTTTDSISVDDIVEKIKQKYVLVPKINTNEQVVQNQNNKNSNIPEKFMKDTIILNNDWKEKYTVLENLKRDIFDEKHKIKPEHANQDKNESDLLLERHNIRRKSVNVTKMPSKSKYLSYSNLPSDSNEEDLNVKSVHFEPENNQPLRHFTSPEIIKNRQEAISEYDHSVLKNKKIEYQLEDNGTLNHNITKHLPTNDENQNNTQYYQSQIKTQKQKKMEEEKLIDDQKNAEKISSYSEQNMSSHNFKINQLPSNKGLSNVTDEIQKPYEYNYGAKDTIIKENLQIKKQINGAHIVNEEYKNSHSVDISKEIDTINGPTRQLHSDSDSIMVEAGSTINKNEHYTENKNVDKPLTFTAISGRKQVIVSTLENKFNSTNDDFIQNSNVLSQADPNYTEQINEEANVNYEYNNDINQNEQEIYQNMDAETNRELPKFYGNNSEDYIGNTEYADGPYASDILNQYTGNNVDQYSEPIESNPNQFIDNSETQYVNENTEGYIVDSAIHYDNGNLVQNNLAENVEYYVGNNSNQFTEEAVTVYHGNEQAYEENNPNQLYAEHIEETVSQHYTSASDQIDPYCTETLNNTVQDYNQQSGFQHYNDDIQNQYPPEQNETVEYSQAGLENFNENIEHDQEIPVHYSETIAHSNLENQGIGQYYTDDIQNKYPQENIQRVEYSQERLENYNENFEHDQEISEQYNEITPQDNPGNYEEIGQYYTDDLQNKYPQDQIQKAEYSQEPLQQYDENIEHSKEYPSQYIETITQDTPQNYFNNDQDIHFGNPVQQYEDYQQDYIQTDQGDIEDPTKLSGLLSESESFSIKEPESQKDSDFDFSISK